MENTKGNAAARLEFGFDTKFKTKPYKHQLECLNRFGRKQAFALLAEMGTGKTWIVIKVS